MRFTYYVLNHNFNAKRVEPFNIFDNGPLQEETEKEVRKYLRAPAKYKEFSHIIDIGREPYIGFEALCENIRSLIMWQEWGRVEYEMSVGAPFETDCNKLQKVDCYEQALPNIECIVREVIYQYKQQKSTKN